MSLKQRGIISFAVLAFILIIAVSSFREMITWQANKGHPLKAPLSRARRVPCAKERLLRFL